MKTIYYSCFFVAFVLLFSCNAKPKTTEAISAIKKIEGKFVMPDSIAIYNPFQENRTASNEIENAPLKIYTFVDTSCPSCLTNINNWSLAASELKKYNIPIIMICQSEDNFELLKYLCEKKDIAGYPFPFYFDLKNQFFLLNKFLDITPHHHTVLTDSTNQILVAGDLTHSQEVKQLYIDKIKHFRK